MENGIDRSLGESTLPFAWSTRLRLQALLLAAIGIYGMPAYTVTLRPKEIGVRMAPGSSRVGITGLVLRQAGWMVVAGVIPGLTAAWADGHAVRSFLSGVRPLDTAILVAAAAVLLLNGGIAAALPAWRAAPVDPMEVLRIE